MFNFMAANLHAPTATIKERLCDFPLLLATPNINFACVIGAQERDEY